MKSCQRICTLFAISMAAALVACSGGSNSSTGGGGGGGGGNPISVSLGTVPSSLNENATASVTATVANDTANQGVTWSCTPSSACGSFNPTSTASGSATTYTAPSAVPSGNTVTITATSVSDTTKSASSAPITITVPPPALADGTYVFSLNGLNNTAATAGVASQYAVAGVFVVKGGAITGGEQDYVSCCVADTDLINATGSGITTTADGNLQITLVTCSGKICTSADTNVGVNGVETFNGSMITTSSGRLIEYDTAATSSGTIDLQPSAPAAPTGGYAFAVQGNNSAGSPLAIGGILNISGGALSTADSVFDLENAGVPFSAQTFSAGTVTGPDTSGRIVFSLTPSNAAIPQGIAFAGYMVDATHIRLVEITDKLGGSTGGTAYGQNSTNLAVSGNSYVVGMTGSETNGSTLHAAGLLSLGSTGNVTGTVSYNDLLAIQPAGSITAGTYLADTTNPGRVTLTGVTDGTNTFNIQLYVDGNGNVLAITLDTSQDILEGVGYLQTGGGSFAAGSFSGTYVMNATGADVTNEFELDSVGPVAADGVGSLAGFADINWFGSGTAGAQTTNAPVSGTFTAASSGVFSGTITGLDVTTSTNQDAFTYYLVDTTKVIAIEVDANQLTLGDLYLAQ